MEKRLEVNSDHEERSHIGEQTVVEGATQIAAWTNGDARRDISQPVMSGMDQLLLFVMQRYVISSRGSPSSAPLGHCQMQWILWPYHPL